MTLFGRTRIMPDFSLEPADAWRERAACRGEDPEIFHRIAMDDPIAEGKGLAQIKAIEFANFHKAQAICANCPVKKECKNEGQVRHYSGDSALNSGSTYAIYGGELPKGYSYNGRGRPRNVSLAELAEKVCSRGHKGDWRREGNGHRCRKCVQLRASGDITPGRPTLAQMHENNAKGHEFEPGPSGKRTVCKACRRDILKKYRKTWTPQGPRSENPTIDWDARHLATKGHAPEWSGAPSGRYCKECGRNRKRKSVDKRGGTV